MHKKHFNRFLNTPIPTSVSDSLSYYEEIQRLERGVNDLSEDVDELSEDFDDLSEEVNEVSETVGDFDERITANTTSINSLSSGIEGISTRLTTAENNISSLDSMIDSAQDDIYELQEETTTLGGNLATFNNNSIGRDNALSSRVSLLEDATIHEITVTNSAQNFIINGGDLRLPAAPSNFYFEGSGSGKIKFVANSGYYYDKSQSGGHGYLRIYDIDNDRTNNSPNNLLTPYTLTLLFTDDPVKLLHTYTASCTITRLLTNTQNVGLDDSSANQFAQVQFNDDDGDGYHLRIRFNSNYAGTEFNQKYIIGFKLERGEQSTGILLDKRDYFTFERVKNLINSLMPTINPTTYRNVFTEIDLTSGETTFEDCKIQVALSEQLGILSGFIAVYLQVDAVGSTIDMSDGCTYQLDVSSLNIKPKVNIGANISGFYSNVLNRQQCDIVLTNDVANTKINTIELRMNSAPVFIPRASEDDTVGLFMVVSINDLVSAAS